MKQIIIYGLIMFSLVFTRRDCLKQAETDVLGRSTRPAKDIIVLSDSGYFYIHYDITGSAAPDLTDNNGNGIPDYIDEVGIIADSARHVLVNIMGFNPPPSDADSIYDIYIKSYPEGSYGENYKDQPSQNDSLATSYLLIDNDYVGFDSQFGLSEIEIMRISLGHEFFHGIQWGYERNKGNNSYFYEMTSMWFEDLLIPDGNDYLDGWADDLLTDPTADFDNTGGGYELALFGHYLSSFIDTSGVLDAKNSTIMREIWERYDTTSSNVFSSVKFVLENSYNISFIEAWTDFMTRNLYNGLYENMDNEFYYYPDQALINPIRTYKTSIDDSLSISVNIDNKSVEILTYEIIDFIAILDIKHDQDDFIGNIVLLADNSERNSYENAKKDSLTKQLYKDDVVHLIYGAESTAKNLSIDIVQYTSPILPSNLIAETAQDSIILNWHPSPGPGDSLTYIIYRNADSIYALSDTHYVDNQSIEGLISYTYHVTCFNDIGESHPSNTITIQSWPSENNVTEDQILSIYPNPIHKTHDSHILYALGTNYSNTTLELINIRGQIVERILIQSYKKGWHRESISNLISPEIATGIYIIRIRHDNEFGRSQKITILP